jgi:hypothetical protein
VPPVADLDCGGQRAADGFGVGAGAVAAHDLDAGMLAQPSFGDVGGAAGQHVDALAGRGVDEHGGVAAAAAQREVVDPEHLGHRRRGQRNRQQHAQRGVPGHRSAQRRQHPGPGPLIPGPPP